LVFRKVKFKQALIFEKKNIPLKKELPSEIRHSLILIFKEFLTNTVKHANASKVVCQFYLVGKKIIIQLKDNGKGINDETKIHTGQGMENMAMRAEKIKADLSFIHKDGFGIKLEVQIL